MASVHPPTHERYLRHPDRLSLFGFEDQVLDGEWYWFGAALSCRLVSGDITYDGFIFLTFKLSALMPDMRPPMRRPRPGEIEIDLPATNDAALYFIGRVRTPWKTLAECPKNTAARKGIDARLELDPPFAAGLKDLELLSHVIVLYWLDRSRRDFIIQAPSHAPEPRGVFALRSPVRPNPIGLAVAEVHRVEGNTVLIRNMDCVDGTPLIDIKPYFSSMDSVPNAKRP